MDASVMSTGCAMPLRTCIFVLELCQPDSLFYEALLHGTKMTTNVH
jgi:hypothetical protein